MSARPGPVGGGTIKVVFSVGNVGNYLYFIQQVPSGGRASGSASGVPSATVPSGVYTGQLSAMGNGSITFSGDVTLVFGPLVTVLGDD